MRSRTAVGRGRRIAGAALLIMLGNLASRILGLVREQVIAGLFATSWATDAFVAASTLPTLIYDMMVGGMISAALVPVFSELAERDREELRRVGGTVLTLAALGLAGVILLLEGGADLLLRILAPGLPPEIRPLALTMVRWILPAAWLMGLSGVATALNYARHRYAPPAFSTAAYNAGIVAGTLLLAPVLGPRALVVGVLLGAAGQLGLQFLGLRDGRFRPALAWRHPALQRILVLYAPVAVSLVVSGAGVLLDRNLATRVGEGTLAAMRFATTLVQLPLGLVVAAVSFAILPTLSRLDARGEEAAYRETLGAGLRAVLALIVPAAVGLWVLAEPTVALLFQRGAFGAASTALTATALRWYLPGLIAAALDQPLIFAFYARKDTLRPVLVGIAAVGVYAAVALGTVGRLGMRGLVLADTCKQIFHAGTMLLLLARRDRGLAGYDLGNAALKVGAAALAMGGALRILWPRLPAVWVQGPALLGTLPATVALAGIGYLAAVTALGVQEPRRIWDRIRERLGSPPPPSEGGT